MKTLKQLLYTLLLTASFASLIACSEDDKNGVTPIDNMGGLVCSACPAGYGNSLSKSALGKNYDVANAERFQVVLHFFGIANSTWQNYPLSPTGLASQGFLYANQPITCDGINVIVPQGRLLPLQTLQPGELSQYYTVNNMIVGVGGTSVQMIISNAALSPIPFNVNAVDYNGNSHALVINDYQVEFLYGGRVCPRVYNLGIQ